MYMGAKRVKLLGVVLWLDAGLMDSCLPHLYSTLTPSWHGLALESRTHQGRNGKYLFDRDAFLMIGVGSDFGGCVMDTRRPITHICLTGPAYPPPGSPGLMMATLGQGYPSDLVFFTNKKQIQSL